MGQIRRKDGALAFILFTPKWTKIQDLDKIEYKINITNSILVNA